MQEFLSEFGAFLQNYNVVGIAIGLIIATKVGALVSSLVENLITPAILAPLFKKLHLEKLDDLSFNGILYGKVLANLIDFIVVAFLVFLVVKNMEVTVK